jgi:hypothetical protein
MRLGLILLGIGIIYLGFYLQREGFQSGSGYGSGPGSGPGYDARVLQGVLASSIEKGLAPTLTNADILTGDMEIANKFNLVKKVKDSADKILAKYISDSDTFLKLNFIYKEVHGYTANSVDFKDLTMKGPADIKPDLQNLNYIVKDYANILFKIYITFPTIMLSSDSPGESSYDAIIDETVLTHAAEMIQSELKLIPSPMTRITNMQTTLSSNANGLKASMTDNAISIFKDNIEIYGKMILNEFEGLKLYYRYLVAANLPAKSSRARSDIVTFLNNTISFMTSIQTLLKNVPNMDKNILSSISTQITTYNTFLENIDTKESFQSIMNPYGREGFQSTKNPYSPLTYGLAQGIEFIRRA